jgi:hypothetical protein
MGYCSAANLESYIKMKQCKILYEKCKKKLPNRPPDEIDFGLGFRAALGWLENLPREKDGPNTPRDLMKIIKEELQ